MRFLKHKEFLPFAPDSGWVRINHESPDCGGDSKSMKIEVQSDGNIFAYCHRCGKSGNYGSPYHTARKDKKGHSSSGSPSPSSRQRAQGYSRSSSDMSTWSEEARRFIFKAGLSSREGVANAIRYDKEIDGVYLTVFNGTETIGYILRRFNYSGPKYINDFDHDTGPRIFVPQPVVASSTVVLVEDILSAIKVGRQYAAVALLGTGCNIETTKWLISNFKRFIIFLDDDNKIVKRQQRVLKNTFDVLGEAKIITGVGKDPKHLSNSELREIIDGA